MKKRMLALLLIVTLTLAAAVPAAAAGCPVSVDYHLGTQGVSEDLTSEKVNLDAKPAHVPEVKPLKAGVPFLGWSLTNPATVRDPTTLKLVDPTTVRVQGDTTFYAVYGEQAGQTHSHYVIGYPDGNFGPGDNITRGSVATIIARAILPGFVEGADYDDADVYSDVENHWAKSAIAYCTKYGVFKGYDTGEFAPDAPITRQEFALAIARLDGTLENQGTPFTDEADIADWAIDGVYTAFFKGWVDGYTDGTFKPENNIRRDEAVKIFNVYLNRGVDEAGLADLKAVGYGEATGEDKYVTWPDVPETQWAYYHIIEASNDHEYNLTGEDGKSLPERWLKAGVDAKWLPSD